MIACELLCIAMEPRERKNIIVISDHLQYHGISTRGKVKS